MSFIVICLVICVVTSTLSSNIPSASYNKLEENDNVKYLSNQKNISQSINAFTYDNKTRFEIVNNDGKIIQNKKIKCITCTNIDLDECNDPSNEIVPIQQCPYEGDSCFSKHSPFGIVSRGCYSYHYNISYYVCSCNLCNFLSIQEMPFFFPQVVDWRDNVIALTKTKNYRDTLFRDIECLECEVNVADSQKQLDHSMMHCLEGDLKHISNKKCAVDEICGIQAIRSKNYIWRGCIKFPLYNSWWRICNEDNCNNDALLVLNDINVIEV